MVVVWFGVVIVVFVKFFIEIFYVLFGFCVEVLMDVMLVVCEMVFFLVGIFYVGSCVGKVYVMLL